MNSSITKRDPVVVVMGHIDHGKSTLLDYIRKTDTVLKEAGGITQHISAYEVEHTTKDGEVHKITFLDTPGHEAFCGIRTRSATVADIAILVVSAEDGVKPQTVEALKCIRDDETPFIVAITKIDKEGADIERTKQNLAENEIYLEGYGGNVPVVSISSKTGEGIPELFDMMLLVAMLEELSGDRDASAEGIVFESNLDTKKGISANVVVKNGTLKKGMFVVAGDAIAPVRHLENFLGENIETATFSNPIKIIGWDKLPKVGMPFKSFDTKIEAIEFTEKQKDTKNDKISQNVEDEKKEVFPIIIKADTAGSLEALFHEINKITHERIAVKIIHSGVGSITENDIRVASGKAGTVVLGFNTKIDSQARSLAEQLNIKTETFDIIYKLTEWVTEKIKTKAPKIEVEETVGSAKILKVFSKTRDNQVLGGKVVSGSMILGQNIKIMRRGEEIGRGKVKELQKQKEKTSEVTEGNEFGVLIEAKTEIAGGDVLEIYKTEIK